MSSSPPSSTSSTPPLPLYVSNPEQWLEETIRGPDDLVGLVIFRGSWCPYDHYYLCKLGRFIQSQLLSTNEDKQQHVLLQDLTTGEKSTIRLIAWTSEGAKGAKRADDEWKLTKEYGYSEVIGDETAALAKYLKEEELVLPDLVILQQDNVSSCQRQAIMKQQHSHHNNDDDDDGVVLPEDASSYPNGMVLANQVWWAHHGTVCFEWSSKGDHGPDFGGPSGRPDPAFVWEQVCKRKHALDHGNAVMPAHGDNIKMCATSELEIKAAGCNIG
jgi:hypothetical protein